MNPEDADAGGPVDVLVVEDNPGDARLLREAFDDLDRTVDLEVVTTGGEALELLAGVDDDARPALVILDLDLPGTDGRAVLRELKSDPSLRRIPVIVFSTADGDDDVAQSYDDHANAYVTKPADLDGYFETVRRLDAFWLSAATLPPAER